MCPLSLSKYQFLSHYYINLDRSGTTRESMEPNQQQSSIRQEEEEEDEEREGHFHVLAVDDSLIERKMLEKLLTISSYHVTCVESGDKALEYLGLVDHRSHHDDHDHDNHNHDGDDDDDTVVHSLPSADHQAVQRTRVNLIMTDYSMPGINGYDLLKRVKRSSWKDVPVVIMSSENVPSRIDQCLEGGAEDFLLKPVNLSDLKKLQPHILKSSSIKDCNGSNRSSNRQSSSNYELVANDDDDDNNNSDNSNDCDYEEIFVDDYAQNFDKGKKNVDDENFDKRLQPEGLTTV